MLFLEFLQYCHQWHQSFLSSAVTMAGINGEKNTGSDAFSPSNTWVNSAGSSLIPAEQDRLRLRWHGFFG